MVRKRASITALSKTVLESISATGLQRCSSPSSKPSAIFTPETKDLFKPPPVPRNLLARGQKTGIDCCKNICPWRVDWASCEFPTG
ncbi:hypothetical protein IAQ61_008971 [Plenodomus lingam]|uniref:uncharacterized protein n=1 Tax=Leptosphaeria maculans TaxID=5022 RepID=UPI0033214203|nr:hypothetical protein IAQ61_008971 [Plenodomus lingam]